ncbi:MAG: hypothetical protein QM539_02095 [Alphaproteobacteria bacterium]|nr:hypothetical protein [Alphaproteobacteria bacterium]
MIRFLIKILVIVCPFLIIHQPCSAQEKPNGTIVNLTKITPFTLGISREIKVGNSKSIVGKISLNPFRTYIISPLLFGITDRKINLSPSFNLQYRNYYNFENRKNKNKRTNLNSANYFGPSLSIIYSVFNDENDQFQARQTISTAGFVWGLQRTYKKRLNLELNLGLGLSLVQTSSNDHGIKLNTIIALPSPIAEFNIGILLNTKQKRKK